MAENFPDLRAEQQLLALIRDKFCNGVTAELARRIGKDSSYVSRLFYPQGKNGAKGIGLEVMKACEAAFQLPAGFWSMTSAQAAEALNLVGAPSSLLGAPRSPASALVTQLVALAKPHRPTLRKNLAALVVDLLENPDDPELVEQTIKDIERFYER